MEPQQRPEDYDIACAHRRGTKAAIVLFSLIGALAAVAIVAILLDSPDLEHIIACVFIALTTLIFVVSGIRDCIRSIPRGKDY